MQRGGTGWGWARPAIGWLALGALTAVLSAAAGEWHSRARFERLALGAGDGPHDAVAQILQDRRGALWFCTETGLARYDGTSVRRFGHDPANANSLSFSMVRSICESRDGRLWIGTCGHGLDRYDPLGERWEHYRFDPHNPDSLGNDNIHGLAEDRQGVLWIATERGLSRYEPATREWTRFLHDPQDPDSLGEDRIYALCLDRNGCVWLGTLAGGVSRFDPRHHRWTRFRHQPDGGAGPSADTITAIDEGPDGRMWFGTKAGLDSFDPAANRWQAFRHLPASDNSPGGETVLALLPDADGMVWASWMSGGLGRLDPSTGHWAVYRHDPDDPASLADDMVFSLAKDVRGTLWIGTYARGVAIFSAARNRWRLLRPGPANARGGGSGEPHSLYPAGSDGLWVGTRSGLRRITYDYASDAGTDQETLPPPPPEVRGGVARVLLVDRQGVMWVRFAGLGTRRFDPQRRSWLPLPAGVPPLVSGGHFTPLQMLQAPDGTIWLSLNENGLYRYDPASGRWVVYRHDPARPDSLRVNTTTVICRDRDGSLLCGLEDSTRSWLDRFDPASGRFTHLTYDPADPNTPGPGIIYALSLDEAGALWVGTSSGLNRLGADRRRWERFYDFEGTPLRGIACILPDIQAKLWLVRLSGVSRFDPATRSFVDFDRGQGLPSPNNALWQHACRIGATVFLATATGILAFRPELVVTEPPPPPVLVADWHFQDRGVPVEGVGAAPGREPGAIVLTVPGRHARLSLEFTLSVVDAAIPPRSRYSCKLEGIDRDWQQLAEGNVARYPGVAPGRYTLRVQGAGADGVWNRAGASLQVVIRPPLWLTGWFLALAIGVGLFGAYLLVRFWRRHVLVRTFWNRRHQVGQYTILRELGHGGMATVYLARHRQDRNRLAALKLLREEYALDPLSQKRFRQEGAIVDQLDHPHIVRIYERGLQGNNLYLAMEYLPGRTLAERLQQAPPLSLEEWRAIVGQLADVLGKIHSHGIIHRDLKPANVILVENAAARPFVKVLDFGLARQQMQSTVTEWGGLLGTIQYIAPEQLRESLYIPAGDIYALGMIAYEMAVGRHPFAGENSLDILKRILESTPADLATERPDMPPAYCRLVMRMIAKEPQLRPSAPEVQAGLG